MTKNRTPTPVYLDPGMHSGLEVKGLRVFKCFKLHSKCFLIMYNSLILPNDLRPSAPNISGRASAEKQGYK